MTQTSKCPHCAFLNPKQLCALHAIELQNNLTCMEKSYATEVERHSVTRAKLDCVREAMHQALSDFARIESADWNAEQMRMSAEAGTGRLRIALKRTIPGEQLPDTHDSDIYRVALEQIAKERSSVRSESTGIVYDTGPTASADIAKKALAQMQAEKGQAK